MWHREGEVLIPGPTMALEYVGQVRKEMHILTGESVS
jgi:hypothetical protein